MNIGYDKNTIEGYLKINDYKITAVYDRRKSFNIGTSFEQNIFEITFKKNNVTFTYEVVAWYNGEINTYLYYEYDGIVRSSGIGTICVIDDATIIRSLKRRLKKFYKEHPQF